MRLDGFLRCSIAMALLVPAIAQSQSDAEKAVLATVHRLFEGMRTADSAMVRSTFAPGVRFASIDPKATPPVVKYDGVDSWLGGIATSARRWDEQVYDVQVRVDGDMAQVWAPYTFYLDKAVRHCGIDSMELLRDGAGWKITQLSDTRRREGCRDVLAK
jgi:uncharacterized protein DUF4440